MRKISIYFKGYELLHDMYFGKIVAMEVMPIDVERL